jgi:hypothetical protein
VEVPEEEADYDGGKFAPPVDVHEHAIDGASVEGVLEQISASTTHQTNLFAGISLELKKLLPSCLKTNELGSLACMNKQSCLLLVLSAMKTYPRIKIKNLDDALI